MVSSHFVRRGALALYREARLNHWSYLFVLPALAILGAFLLYPALYAFRMSFYDWQVLGQSEFVGMENYRRFFEMPNVRLAVQNTVYYTALNVPGTLFAALFVALLLNAEIRARAWFRVLFYLPVISSDVAVSLLWKWIYWAGARGLLNNLIGVFGLPPQDWLGDPKLAMPAIVLLTIWKGMGGNVLIFLAGLQSIPPELYEAATMDGAGLWARFRHVTWPLLRPVTLIVLLLLTISSLQVFTPVFVMTGGGPANHTLTIAFYIYNLAFGSGLYGFAAAVSYLLFAAILGITVIQRRYFGDVIY
ncbi:MAG: sugar ABC transporter permease [Chloroflexi bacterium]|nr:sugar ABC transporter permease [Chloroflexota bacterium]MBI5828203.1 sugar ABC transporter permease [Chloroflexota bacterium]